MKTQALAAKGRRPQAAQSRQAMKINLKPRLNPRKLAFWAAAAAVAAAFLHYTMPQRDIVRIQGAEAREVYTGWRGVFWTAANSGPKEGVYRDSRQVFLIHGVDPEGRARTYRNENTELGWPPYFKFKSETLQRQMAELASPSRNPVWIEITHYGWRMAFLDIYPNALSFRTAEGPEDTRLPLMNLAILALAWLFFGTIWHIARDFHAKMLRPVLAPVYRLLARLKPPLTALSCAVYTKAVKPALESARRRKKPGESEKPEERQAPADSPKPAGKKSPAASPPMSRKKKPAVKPRAGKKAPPAPKPKK